MIVVVIESKPIVYTKLTTMEYKAIKNGTGVMISTRLPLNTIVVTDAGKIEITRKIIMELADTSSSRKLQAKNTDTIAQGSEEPSFDLAVTLGPGLGAKDPEVSTGMFTTNSPGGIVLVFALAYMMW